MAEQLFDRQGNEYTGPVSYNDKGAPYYIGKRACARCGGQGVAGWHPSGLANGVCFQCGGACYYPQTMKLYTAEKLEKMNAAQAKRDAKKAEADRIAAEEKAARIAAKKEQAIAEAKPLLDRIEALGMQEGEGFLADIYQRVMTQSALLTDRQIEAVANTIVKIEKERARKENADYVGQVGERREFELTFIRSIELPDYGNQYLIGPQYITIAHDQNGNTIVYKGKFDGLFSTEWNRERERREIVIGAKSKVKATVKEHKEYNGEKQTVINRPKIL